MAVLYVLECDRCQRWSDSGYERDDVTPVRQLRDDAERFHGWVRRRRQRSERSEPGEIQRQWDDLCRECAALEGDDA